LRLDQFPLLGLDLHRRGRGAPQKRLQPIDLAFDQIDRTGCSVPLGLECGRMRISP
jgi:hypothetical protein